jgi:hypothetical protein
LQVITCRNTCWQHNAKKRLCRRCPANQGIDSADTSLQHHDAPSAGKPEIDAGDRQARVGTDEISPPAKVPQTPNTLRLAAEHPAPYPVFSTQKVSHRTATINSARIAAAEQAIQQRQANDISTRTADASTTKKQQQVTSGATAHSLGQQTGADKPAQEASLDFPADNEFLDMVSPAEKAGFKIDTSVDSTKQRVLSNGIHTYGPPHELEQLEKLCAKFGSIFDENIGVVRQTEDELLKIPLTVDW